MNKDAKLVLAALAAREMMTKDAKLVLAALAAHAVLPTHGGTTAYSAGFIQEWLLPRSVADLEGKLEWLEAMGFVHGSVRERVDRHKLRVWEVRPAGLIYLWTGER